jgi:hypothetical protein
MSIIPHWLVLQFTFRVLFTFPFLYQNLIGLLPKLVSSIWTNQITWSFPIFHFVLYLDHLILYEYHKSFYSIFIKQVVWGFFIFSKNYSSSPFPFRHSFVFHAAMAEWLSCSARTKKVLCSSLGAIRHGMTLDKSLTAICLGSPLQ